MRRKIIGKLSLEKIYEASSLFSRDHWKYLLPEQVIVCEFDKIAESKLAEMVANVFNSEAIAKDVIPNISSKQLDIIKTHLPSVAKKYLPK
ncbi:MAG: hypothetical protein H0W50_11145 [Parachlamydiaceae bacterium]|nr:hypothetical protein [Parachlamydiaceae bacterium]